MAERVGFKQAGGWRPEAGGKDQAIRPEGLDWLHIIDYVPTFECGQSLKPSGLPPAPMRYLVTARVKPGKERALIDAIESHSLGCGSVAGGEYLRNMTDARLRDDGSIRWVEVCFCEVPLDEERPYWEAFFELTRVQDAHGRHRCRDLDGSEPWACCDCDCTEKLEARLKACDRSFLEALPAAAQH
jgi:hypothetical protein